MKPLTDSQHRALGRCRSKSGVPVSGPRVQPDGRRRVPEGHVSWQIANVLIDLGFAQIVEGRLRITKAGEREFARVRPEGPGTFLDRNPARPLTHSLVHAASDEPEVMVAPKPDWREHSAAIHLASRRDVDALRLSGLPHPEERLAELRRMAAERGVDVSGDVGAIQRRLDAMERKVTRSKAA